MKVSITVSLLVVHQHVQKILVILVYGVDTHQLVQAIAMK